MIYSKEIPLRYETDVFVLGAGPSGIAAAISAARSGKKVFLAENNGSFGGTGTVGLVNVFAQFTDGKKFLVGGIGREIRDLAIGKDCDFKRGFYPYSGEKLKRIYDKLITAEKNIKFAFFTRLVDAVSSDGHVEYVVLSSKFGLFAVKAKIYIDCSGDGDLCAYAGGEFEYGDEKGETMPPTLVSFYAGIDFERSNRYDKSILDKALADKVFTNEDRHVPGIFKGEGGTGIANVGHVFGTNATDDESLTKAMIDGRRIASEFEYYYKNYINGHENSFVCYTADMLGIRESRRIIGDYRLTGEDFLCRAEFDDEIGRYAYPVDIHIMKPTKEAYDAFHKEYTNDMCYAVGESYGIPYRILTPKRLSNVLVAGRCVSTDRQMQASIRVMPGCFITGQAVGIAASLCTDTEDVRSVNISELRVNIANAGGIVRGINI